MRLDPAAWTISLVGCFYDWLMTRDWKKVFLGMVPVLILLAAVAVVVRGQTLNKDRMALWYLELGEKEIEGWDKRWAPDAASKIPSSGSSEQNSQKEGENKKKAENPESVEQELQQKQADEAPATKADSGSSDESDPPAQKLDDKELSPFAMVLFRRVLQLQSGDQRAQWVIGMIMAQRGSLNQAKERMRRIAPDDREGYVPAHAWMAQYLIAQRSMLRELTSEYVQTTLHHLTTAIKGSRVPLPLLLTGSQFLWEINQRDLAVELLQRAAQADPQYSLSLAKSARALSNLRRSGEAVPSPSASNRGLSVSRLDDLAAHAEQQAESLFTENLRKDPRDSRTRLLLAEAYVNQRRLADAEALLREGLLLKETPQLKRGLSEVWRLRYVVSCNTVDGKLSADIQALETALFIDPSNPMIAQEVAQLARMGGDKPPKDLLDQLRSFLADGKATSATHAWIAEHHLVRGEYKESIPHLEQVVNRVPEAADYLNNLAYVLAKVAPQRLGQALGFSRRATKVDPLRADFHDTQGIVLMKMSNATEALTAFEEAIRLEPSRAEFHTRAAEAYAKLGDQVMADQHLKRAQALNDEAKKSPIPVQPVVPYAPEPQAGQIPQDLSPAQNPAP